MAHPSGLSLTVELSQLLNRRRTDVDDLLLNTLGALLGLLLYRLYCRIRRLPAPEPGPPAALAPALYIAVPFLCRFLLYNEWGLAKLLYGFCPPSLPLQAAQQPPPPPRAARIQIAAKRQKKSDDMRVGFFTFRRNVVYRADARCMECRREPACRLACIGGIKSSSFPIHPKSADFG